MSIVNEDSPFLGPSGVGSELRQTQAFDKSSC